MGKTIPMTKQSKQSKRMKQLSFLGTGLDKPKDCFGGSLLKGNPKSKRPLSSKLPLHLVLRTHTKNSMRKPKTFKMVNDLVYRTAKKHAVKIYRFSNNGNHLHIVGKIPHINRWSAFIRELTGRIAQKMQGLRGPQKGEKYWAHRPFTRIVQGWRRAFQIAKEYVELNQLEAEGFIDRKQTKTLKDLRSIFETG